MDLSLEMPVLVTIAVLDLPGLGIDPEDLTVVLPGRLQAGLLHDQEWSPLTWVKSGQQIGQGRLRGIIKRRSVAGRRPQLGC